MAIVVYGVTSIPLGLDEFLLNCKCCEKHSWADVMISSKYFHVYGLPISPLEKDASIICKECGLKRQSIFDKNLIPNYDEIKTKYKHPVFLYSGIIAAVFFILAIIWAIISKN